MHRNVLKMLQFRDFLRGDLKKSDIKHHTGPVGIKEIAALTNTSMMTVSRALRGVEGVSEAKRAQIQDIARQMNYVPNSNARSLVVANATLVGISLPNLFNDVFADVLNGMRGTFENAGYDSVVDTTEYDPARELAWVERFLSWQPAAIILTGIHHQSELRDILTRNKVPTLEIWDYSADPIDICVGIDHQAAGLQIGRYCVELGYRTPAFVGVSKGEDQRADTRLRGIRQAFEELQAPVFVRAQRPSGLKSFQAGYDGTLELLANYKPDVVFYLNDHMAFGGMMAAQKLGIDVPGEMGVVGFNGLDINNVLPVTLTTVITPRRLMGIMGARSLLARIHGVKTERAVALPVQIVTGQTTRKQL
ncbi:LacI family DNA-binding transcriptional regulator [Algirhabdus cladophorae]|uniref:LacI family DNA-binding transcriptional regulator n=1 Tax=Algirhabdus cladophorae TaxID=3377108 RepID=UPI003B847DAE